MIKREDLFGTEILIGDLVAFNPPYYKGLERAFVIGFTPKMVKLSQHPGSEDSKVFYVGHKDLAVDLKYRKEFLSGRNQ